VGILVGTSEGVTVGTSDGVGNKVLVAVGLGNSVAVGDGPTPLDRGVGVNAIVTVAVDVLVPVAVGVKVNVVVNAGVNDNVAVGYTILVGGTPNIALTVSATEVLRSLISGAAVEIDRISAAVGGVGSKNAIAYTIQTMLAQIVTARNACKGMAYSRTLIRHSPFTAKLKSINNGYDVCFNAVQCLIIKLSHNSI
jgi:hypothetical protein